MLRPLRDGVDPGDTGRCALWLALIAALSIGPGCGPAPPPLPPPLAAPVEVAPGDASRAPLADRAFGRSGFACLDCHAHTAASIRPAPPLSGSSPPGWHGRAPTAAAAITRCIERYSSRPAPADAVADLVAALGAPATAAPSLPAEPAALYAAACRHCHEDGPAGAVLGRPHRAAALRATIRGTDRPPHPATLMPPFTVDTLPDAALDALVEWLTTTGYTGAVR